jgi:hypothetical protein
MFLLGIVSVLSDVVVVISFLPLVGVIVLPEVHFIMLSLVCHELSQRHAEIVEVVFG